MRTLAHDRPAAAGAPGGVEARLVRRVLDALLREDFRGMLTRSTLLPGQAANRPAAQQTARPGSELPGQAGEGVPVPDDGAWLAFGDGLLLPVRPGAFLCDLEVRRGELVRDGAVLRGLGEVLAALRPVGDPEAEAGFDSFAAECHEALAADRAAAAAPPPPAGLRPGPDGALAHEARAARRPHPVYPTSSARRGLRVADLRAYAPEHTPEFDLRWAAVARGQLLLAGELPTWWPVSSQLGLEGLDGTHVAVPVHPLAWRGLLPAAAVRAPRAAVRVAPTLSMRTVAVLADPATHLKLPLPTATLGALNRRTLRAGDLADAAAADRLLRAVAAAEPAYAGRILHADEATYGHAGSDLLAFAVRRLPDLTHHHVLPVAALDGSLLARLAASCGREPLDLFTDYLDLLLGWHVTLWLRHGIALESHQQNVALVLAPAGGIRLLYKDDDGLRVDPSTCRADWADPRIAAAGPADLADVFTTITLHLCAAAPALALAEDGLASRAEMLALVRDRLAAAAAAHAGARDVTLLHERVLAADRLPVKAMLTAGTLLPKSRTGAADVNKFYVRTGPNYLAPRGREPETA